MEKPKISFNKPIKYNLFMASIFLLISVALAFLLAAIFAAKGGGASSIVVNIPYIIVVGVLIFAVIELLHLYGYYSNNRKHLGNKNLVVMLSAVVLTIIAAISTMRYIAPYAVPLVMVSVLVCVLVGNKIGYMATTATAIIALIVFSLYSIIFDGSGIVMYQTIVQGVCGIIIAVLQSMSVMYMVQRYYTRFKLIWGGLFIGLVYFPLSILTRCLITGWEPEALLSGLWQFAGHAIGVGVFTAILPIYESVFDVWTDFKLAEACSMSRPLLKRLAEEAPGTFNHCVIVSNLCESCAIAIGENPFFAKVCGIYHDVGKLSNSEYFVENQQDYNPHDDLIPEQSVKIITGHTALGYDLLRENHMPEEIAIIAKEHHGTTSVMYFFNKAQSLTERPISQENFQYEGPKPSTKIAAIVMICDVVEAASRARAAANMDELRSLVNSIVNGKIKEDQFSECNITFQDLAVIKETIIKVIPAIFHKRISYDIKKEKGTV